MYKFWSHRWINAEDDEEHPHGGGLQSTALEPSGPPVLPEWKGKYVDRVQQTELNLQKTEPGVVEEDGWEPERDEEGRILLTCSFAHKDRCKALGGRCLASPDPTHCCLQVKSFWHSMDCLQTRTCVLI